MEKEYKGHIIRVTIEEEKAHIHGNQFAESWMERGESLLNSSTGHLVITRRQKRKRCD